VIANAPAAGAITAGGAQAAWFKDSEGNILALIACAAVRTSWREIRQGGWIVSRAELGCRH
jgi:hypothetical protein